METAEKPKSNRPPVTLFRFMQDWIIYSILAVPGGGIIGGIIAFGVSLLVAPLYTWRYQGLPPDESLLLFYPMFLAFIAFTVASIMTALNLLQRWTLQNHFPVALMPRGVLWGTLLSLMPGLISFGLFYVNSDTLLTLPDMALFNWLFTLPILILTIFQWRWLRRYVQRAELWLMAQSAGVVLCGFIWNINPYRTSNVIFACYAITVIASGYVMYRLFTQYNIGEKIKRDALL